MLSYNLLPTTLQLFLASLLWQPHLQVPSHRNLRFELRHQHALSNSSRVVFSDTLPDAVFTMGDVRVRTKKTNVFKPVSQALLQSARFRGATVPWDVSEVDGPDIEDRETLLLLAKMANNAYTEPGKSDWYDIGPNYNITYPFGWEPDADGFRGHIFSTPDNSTVVVSIKGTSIFWPIGAGGPTQTKDKLNDNLLFSCCCARVSRTWSTVCGCYEGEKRCDQGCLEKSLTEESLFYSVGINLYNNITYMYPDSNIWLIGHSLGGALASLVGVTFGVPVVAFEAPAERLAASRLHLPSPPSVQHVTHVYNTGDPIPMGTCTGIGSTCNTVGVALETRCHLGQTIKYDTVSQLGWSANIIHHGISALIEGVLADDKKDWRGNGVNGSVPEARSEEDCVDCFDWTFGDFRNASGVGAAGCGGGLL
ncbi:alpha/beta-hydrolase [Dichomitus squalens LYAD-421 SS1]|uniref:triacylglycerol lipase n=1 Tax=Dichomitus squalens (strain LYAD-421) TaxID=732165 RepID=R7SJI2_DICSQ|nr:alpha/beta-hydrolase [Dichomitus squalens LYAD-421 SS1]EJF56304.1 alpha/beta-hydrolase [Dichomitus squalens LYAD-421 SS1]